MTTQRLLLVLLAAALALAIALAPEAEAWQAGDPEGELPYAFRLDDAPAQGATAPATATPGEIAAAVLTLFGFLGLIAGNLVRWSGDLSWKERSVFATKPPGE
jgi:hypothetical protein